MGKGWGWPGAGFFRGFGLFASPKMGLTELSPPMGSSPGKAANPLWVGIPAVQTLKGAIPIGG